MRPEKLTTKSQEALRDGVDLASRRGNPELVPEHVLLSALAIAADARRFAFSYLTGFAFVATIGPVSYTHLTLPTICSV